MHVVSPVCCGLDVHQAQLTACLRCVSPEGQITLERREFGTTYGSCSRSVTGLPSTIRPVVALESTGVYWRPVYHVLVGTVEVLVGNARDIRPRPGTKTDKADAAWIAELLAHGLIRPSFVPPRDQRSTRSDADAGGAGADPHPSQKPCP
jgi:hypothetical protein